MCLSVTIAINSNFMKLNYGIHLSFYKLCLPPIVLHHLTRCPWLCCSSSRMPVRHTEFSVELFRRQWVCVTVVFSKCHIWRRHFISWILYLYLTHVVEIFMAIVVLIRWELGIKSNKQYSDGFFFRNLSDWSQHRNISMDVLQFYPSVILILGNMIYLYGVGEKK